MSVSARLSLLSSHLVGTRRSSGSCHYAKSDPPAPVVAAAAAGVTIDLTGQLALVTGATGQLGRVMVRTLARAGADVAIHYRSDKEGSAKLCAEVESMGRRAVAVYADVGSKESIEAMRETIAATLGEPHIVITNAVQQYKWTTVLEQSEADYESQFRTSVMQNVLCASPCHASGTCRTELLCDTSMLVCTHSQLVSCCRPNVGVLKHLCRQCSAANTAALSRFPLNVLCRHTQRNRPTPVASEEWTPSFVFWRRRWGAMASPSTRRVALCSVSGSKAFIKPGSAG
jgi:hypothetical protein